MKKQALTLIGVLSLVLAAGSAFAQSDEVRATVPFDFIANQATVPAGTYSITRLDMTSNIVVIHGLNKKANLMVGTMNQGSRKPCDKTKLVFHRYGDRYFLSQIWVEGSSHLRELPKGRLESEMARNSSSQDVVLYASTR
jgi:hypothetical protein